MRLTREARRLPTPWRISSPHRGWLKPLAFRRSRFVEVSAGDETSADRRRRFKVQCVAQALLPAGPGLIPALVVWLFPHGNGDHAIGAHCPGPDFRSCRCAPQTGSRAGLHPRVGRRWWQNPCPPLRSLQLAGDPRRRLRLPHTETAHPRRTEGRHSPSDAQSLCAVFDTNVLVRLIARDDARQTAAAETFIAGGAWVSVSALAEATWVLRSCTI